MDGVTGGGIVSRPLEGTAAETHGVNGASRATSLSSRILNQLGKIHQQSPSGLSVSIQKSNAVVN